MTSEQVACALAALDRAPTAPYHFAPDFESEAHGKEPTTPKLVPPRACILEGLRRGTTIGNGSPTQRQWVSQDLYAYDASGELVGIFSILTAHPDKASIGAFKITVREDVQRQGWGTRLLDAAVGMGIDVAGAIPANKFTP